MLLRHTRCTTTTYVFTCHTRHFHATAVLGCGRAGGFLLLHTAVVTAFAPSGLLPVCCRCHLTAPCCFLVAYTAKLPTGKFLHCTFCFTVCVPTTPFKLLLYLPPYPPPLPHLCYFTFPILPLPPLCSQFVHHACHTYIPVPHRLLQVWFIYHRSKPTFPFLPHCSACHYHHHHHCWSTCYHATFPTTILQCTLPHTHLWMTLFVLPTLYLHLHPLPLFHTTFLDIPYICLPHCSHTFLCIITNHHTHFPFLLPTHTTTTAATTTTFCSAGFSRLCPFYCFLRTLRFFLAAAPTPAFVSCSRLLVLSHLAVKFFHHITFIGFAFAAFLPACCCRIRVRFVVSAFLCGRAAILPPPTVLPTTNHFILVWFWIFYAAVLTFLILRWITHTHTPYYRYACRFLLPPHAAPGLSTHLSTVHILVPADWWFRLHGFPSRHYCARYVFHYHHTPLHTTHTSSLLLLLLHTTYFLPFVLYIHLLPYCTVLYYWIFHIYISLLVLRALGSTHTTTYHTLFVCFPHTYTPHCLPHTCKPCIFTCSAVSTVHVLHTLLPHLELIISLPCISCIWDLVWCSDLLLMPLPYLPDHTHHTTTTYLPPATDMTCSPSTTACPSSFCCFLGWDLPTCTYSATTGLPHLPTFLGVTFTHTCGFWFYTLCLFLHTHLYHHHRPTCLQAVSATCSCSSTGPLFVLIPPFLLLPTAVCILHIPYLPTLHTCTTTRF